MLCFCELRVAMACLCYACKFECVYLVIDIYVVILSFPYEILGMLCIGSAG